MHSHDKGIDESTFDNLQTPVVMFDEPRLRCIHEVFTKQSEAHRGICYINISDSVKKTNWDDSHIQQSNSSRLTFYHTAQLVDRILTP